MGRVIIIIIKNPTPVHLKDEIVICLQVSFQYFDMSPHNDPDDDDEEEGEVVCALETLKEKCGNKEEAQKLKARLDECNERVTSRSQTEETCAEELYDYLHCIDHCTSHSIMNKLK